MEQGILLMGVMAGLAALAFFTLFASGKCLE